MNKSAKGISAIEKATAVAAIKAAPLRHIGLMPQHQGKVRIAVAVPIDPTENITQELDWALDQAAGYWPECGDWAIVCADTSSSSDNIPPDFVLLHDFETSGEFLF